MITADRTRRWRVLASLGALVSGSALVALLGWALTQPGDSAGDGIAGLAATSSPSSTPTPTPTPTPTLTPTPTATLTPTPASTTRTAAPDAAPARAVPRPKVRDAAPGSPGDADPSRPTRLVINDLGVDATVDPVGVQADGAMVIPAAPTSVGWYRFGSAPSDPQGHTVIAGHVATREDGAGALAALRSAEPGMVVKVTDAKGRTTRYTITGREKIVKKSLPVEAIFARDGKPRLVLVTCGGEYIPKLRSHRDNIVVTATPLP